MARHTAISASAAVGAVGAFALARLLGSQLRNDAATHALVPEQLAATTKHTVRGPKDTFIAVWDTPAPRDDVPQIVFVHGWMGTHHVWDWVVRALHTKAHMVTFDLPFHGQSGAPQPEGIDLDFFGDALVHVLDDMVAAGPVVLVGHSLGGMIALNALRRHAAVLAPRLSATVLISTAASFVDMPTPLGNVARPVFGAAEAAVRHKMSRLATRVFAAAVRHDTDLLWLFARKVQGRHAQPAITHGIVQAMRQAHPEALGVVTPSVLALDERAGLAVAASRPLCVIAGSDDWLTPRAISTALGDASGGEVIVLDAIGHVAPKEAADQVAAIIGRYVGVHHQPQVTS